MRPGPLRRWFGARLKYWPLNGDDTSYEGRVTFAVPQLDVGPDRADGYVEDNEPRHVAPLREANTMSSLMADPPTPADIISPDGDVDPDALEESIAGPWHLPCIDIDHPIRAVPSSTPGHYHLLIDKPVRWQRYLDLLTVLAECGLVEDGYVAASEARGATFVRLPWVRKPAPAPAAPPPDPASVEFGPVPEEVW